MFGINGSELAVILVVAALVLGPRNIAQAVKAFRSLVQTAKGFSSNLRAEVNGHLPGIDAPGDPLKSIGLDAGSFDLRDVNPKAIVRKAVREEMDAWMREVDLNSLADLAQRTTDTANSARVPAATVPTSKGVQS